MKLKKIHLENFRNHKSLKYEFGEKENLTIFIGENGKGKTNFLEAIHVLSLGKSFRALFQEDLITWNDEYTRLKCEAITDNEETTLEFFYSSSPKREKSFKKNGVSLRNSEYIGNLLTVLFHPEDMNMLYLSPELRRRYMDILLSQTDKKYLSALVNYKKTIKQRNSLLREIKERKFKGINVNTLNEDLDVWDKGIEKFATAITEKRTKLVEFLNENLEKIYVSISGKNEKIHVNYIKKEKSLLETREIDILAGKTTTGPHLDDLKFSLNNRKIDCIASRGEFRTLLLAIKLAEIKYIREITNKNPILLLDDVFSELDVNRQKHLLKAIFPCQTVITATDFACLGELAVESPFSRIVKM